MVIIGSTNNSLRRRGTQHGPLTPSLKDKQFTSSQRYERVKHKIRKTGSEIHDHNFTVLSFFRQPEARIVSAYYDSRHASGLPPNMWKELIKATHQKQAKHECKIDGISQQSNPLKCFANFPGIAGCMARMLTGETCADGIGSQSGLDNLPMAIDVILNHLDFVGLTEDWNESICQFHRLFAGEVGDDGRRRWVEPLQGEFSNVHKSTKKKNLDVEHLDGFIDVADTVVYEAVKLKFERMVGDERCYKYMTWDELKEQKQIQNQKTDDDGDGDDANEDEDDLPVHFKMDEAGNVCEPKSCSDLGKQCGEWDDGCGRTIICGMCNAGRTGLPSTWRVKCMEGQCIDYCPPWDQKGYWFLPSDDDDVDSSMPDPIKMAREKLGIVKQTHLSPTDAVRICEMAPCKGNGDSALPRLESLVSDGLCKCGSTSKTFNASLTMSDFSTAHDMNEMCRDNVARKGAVLMESDTQPVCCPLIHKKMDLPKGWKKQYSLGAGKNLEGEYFDHVRIECGAFEECEAVAREKDAEMAVFDMLNSMCYLARNLVDLKDFFPVTKDNAYRFAIDLR